MIFLIEIGAHNGSSVVTLRYATESYVSMPSDSPANTRYDGRVQDPGHFARSLYSPGETSQSSDVGYGSIVLANADGGLDALLDYGIDGRSIVIKTLEDRFQPLSSAVTIFRGTAQSIDSSDMYSRLSIALHDRRLELDKPFQETRYTGVTTSGAASTVDEGNADLKDQVKPMVYGRCWNVPMLCVNPYDLIYQAGNNALVSIVAYDKGVPLTPAGNYSTAAALKAASLTPGSCATCLARGLIRLGGAPDGQVTADVVEGSSLALRSAGQIIKRILTYRGYTTSDYSDASISTLDSLNNSEVGIYVSNEANTIELIQQLLDTIGGWISTSALGVFEVGRLSAPGAPAAILTEREILDGRMQFIRMNDEGGGIPAYRVILRYQPIWTIMGKTDLAGCVQMDSERQTFLTTEWRETKAENLATKTKHQQSPELKFDTLFADEPDASTEATRRLALYGTRRDRVSVEVKRGFVASVKPGDTVQIKIARFGYSGGRNMVAIGIESDYEGDIVKLDLWG